MEDKTKEKEMPPWWKYTEDYFRKLHLSDLVHALPSHPWESDRDLLMPPAGRPHSEPFEDGLPKAEPAPVAPVAAAISGAAGAAVAAPAAGAPAAGRDSGGSAGRRRARGVGRHGAAATAANLRGVHAAAAAERGVHRRRPPRRDDPGRGGVVVPQPVTPRRRSVRGGRESREDRGVR